MKVDVHTHVIPAAVVAAARGTDGVFGVREVDGELVHPEGFRSPLTADFHDVSAIHDRMDGAGIDSSIVSLSPTMFFYDRDPGEAIRFATAVNDGIAELVSESSRLGAVAQLPMQAPAEAVEELKRAVTELGFLGAQIGTNVGSQPLDDRELEPIFAAAARLGVPVMLHPYFVGPKPRLGEYYLTNSIGNPLDTCIAGARLMHCGIFDRQPDLDVVLVHGGGYLPYQLGRLDHAFAVRLEPSAATSSPPSSFLGRFWFDALTHSDAAARFLVELVGEERLLLGTDLPYDMADAQPLERLGRVGIDADLLGANAATLFKRRRSPVS